LPFLTVLYIWRILALFKAAIFGLGTGAGFVDMVFVTIPPTPLSTHLIIDYASLTGGPAAVITGFLNSIPEIRVLISANFFLLFYINTKAL